MKEVRHMQLRNKLRLAPTTASLKSLNIKKIKAKKIFNNLLKNIHRHQKASKAASRASCSSATPYATYQAQHHLPMIPHPQVHEIHQNIFIQVNNDQHFTDVIKQDSSVSKNEMSHTVCQSNDDVTFDHTEHDLPDNFDQF